MFCGFHFSPYITGVITCHGENYVHGSDDAYRVLVARPAGKMLLGRPRCRCENNIKRLKEIGLNGVDRIYVIQDVSVAGHLNTVMYFWTQ